MEIPISKDIRKFKTKDIGNFSFKQAAFIALALGVAFLTFKFTNSLEVAVLPLVAIICFGFFRPYNMSCFQFLRTVGKDKLTPSIYINETDFVYNLDEFEELYGEEYKGYNDWELIQRSQSLNTKKITKEEKALIIT